ncbi:hypothetical protein [Granulicella tundricola]|uniref:Uncharacterized protein n=1 Tax=Granulicella tundricola (strain ATCC BAA-1859 / DSM 23138 / MP5ACTX9) TaxID=1198114 RepID=E8X688_GRATM|nr:hypothetical protein [Granulicella tundricola]ADW70972.1 hypothetical protein AciX9_4193 [Granulicella tundricola MP5ACTX9]
MSNFLDLEENKEEEPIKPSANLRELLASVPKSTPRPHLNPEVSDKLAAQHGFSSRDHSSRDLTPAPTPAPIPAPILGRRTPRGAPIEETRQLSIRMPISLYADFLAFADAAHLTYSEAIRELLDRR